MIFENYFILEDNFSLYFQHLRNEISYGFSIFNFDESWSSVTLINPYWQHFGDITQRNGNKIQKLFFVTCDVTHDNWTATSYLADRVTVRVYVHDVTSPKNILKVKVDWPSKQLNSHGPSCLPQTVHFGLDNGPYDGYCFNHMKSFIAVSFRLRWFLI